MTPDDARRIALSMPEAMESAHMGHPDFRVRGKIFATLWPDKDRAVVKLEPDHQAMLMEAAPAIFTPAAGAWGRKGWTNLALGAADEATFRSAVTASWRATAPKRLAAEFEKRL
ncbi:MAG: MmcQ/YjbR family DNA-binding protein [Pseudomonadota bacterium]|nr:MmcQ/YjbR family DNA-binding protein [Pseudomonadota bacterium]